MSTHAMPDIWTQHSVRHRDKVLVTEDGTPVTEIPGWRYYLVRQQDALLASPHGTPTGDLVNMEHGPRRLTPWDQRHFTAECPKHHNHRPPVPGCLCGIYISPFLLDVLGMAQQLRLALEATSRPAGIHLAVASVNAAGPVIVQHDSIGMVEARAASVTIEELWIFPEWLRGKQTRQRLKARLKHRYRVPVSIGRPNYTSQDAHHSAAMEIEVARLNTPRH